MEEKEGIEPEKVVREIRRKTRRKFNAEEKIRIVLEGLKGERTISDLCRIEDIHPNQYYKWSKEFLDAGKRRLDGDIRREADRSDVRDLKVENNQLKELVADLSLKNQVLKKSLMGLD